MSSFNKFILVLLILNCVFSILTLDVPLICGWFSALTLFFMGDLHTNKRKEIANGL
jgi:F0F1-type ATP synthase assembly protein I